METIRLAVIPGDGIGPEVVPQGLRVLEAAAQLHGGLRFECREFPWNCAHHLRHGAMMPPDGLRTLADFDGVFLGAVGHPDVPDHVSLWGLLIPIRRTFEQYVNLRPVRLLRGVPSPLAGRGPGDIDFIVVRENTEGEYSSMGGRVHEGTPFEVAAQISHFSRMGVTRVVDYALGLAAGRRGELTVATKSNGIVHTMPFWDEVARAAAAARPEVRVRFAHIDALAAYFVTRPQSFDVVVASNLFGDILTDLGAAIVGSIGIAPSANLNPERRHPSLFEPVHGSAPDIAGQGIANPLAMFLSAALMLRHGLQMEAEAAALESAVTGALDAGLRTPDLGGRASTAEATRAVLEELIARKSR